MFSVMEEAPVTVRQQRRRPYMISHDSLEECSLEHWLGVRQMVEQEFLLIEEIEVVEFDTPVGCA